MLLSIFSGCKTKQEPISFMLLEKHSGKSTIGYGDNGYKYIYREVYLISNRPKTGIKDKLDKQSYDLEFNFFKKNNKICLLEDDITYSAMYFYDKTTCTEHFIENSEDATGFSQTYISDCKGDIEYSFFYKRDINDPNMWIMDDVLWGKRYQDTIYCNTNRKKIKLPDMPN